MCELLSSITGIGSRYLVGPPTVREASVAMKMSWASKQTTTRKEDLAYCLLGLLNVNIPLLYGEGDKAFFCL